MRKKDSLSKSGKKRKQWTILCVGELGNISSIKLSKNSLVMMGVLVGISFFVTIAAIIAYTITRAENIQLRSSLEAVKTELNNTNRKKDNLMAQLLIVQEKLASKQKGSKPSQKIPQKEKEPKKPTHKPSEPALTKQTKSTAQTTSPTVQKIPPINILVENFKLHKDPGTNRVRYEFILRNKRPRKKAVSGYTFVLLKPAKGDPTSWRVSPKTVLQEGKPKDFKRGQLFSIARFKIVRGYIKNTESVDYWEEVVVLVYSASGKLILEKVLEYPKQKPNADTSQQATETVQPDTSISTQTP